MRSVATELPITEHTHRLPCTWGVLPSSIPSSCVPVAVLPFEPLEQGLIATYCLPSDKPIHALLISHLWKCRAVRGGGLREKKTSGGKYEYNLKFVYLRLPVYCQSFPFLDRNLRIKGHKKEPSRQGKTPFLFFTCKRRLKSAYLVGYPL